MESAAEWEAKEVEEAETGWDQEAWGQDRGPDLAYGSIS